MLHLEAVIAACVFAEFIGYWLHVLLHCEWIPFLSRSHMIHHLLVYPPDKPQRQSGEYLLSTYGRASVLGIGLEWLAPVALLLAGLVPALRLLNVPPADQVVFIAAALGWGALMFWYMHDAMHIRGFWMEGNSVLRRWFLAARRRHDIHHMDIALNGRMTRNFGICFFAFDRFFGSYADVHERFNRAGYDAAQKRYANLLAAW